MTQLSHGSAWALRCSSPLQCRLWQVGPVSAPRRPATRPTPAPPLPGLKSLSGGRDSAYPIRPKFFAVPRVVLFCGLEDYVGMRGPDSIPEPWIADMPSKVPRSAIWGVGGTHGGCCSNWMRNWGSGAGGLNLHGQGYADFENGSVVSKSAAGVAAVLKGA